MIGWMHYGLEAFLKQVLDEEAWLKILAESSQSSKYPWADSCPFSDDVTSELITAAAGLIGAPPNDLLEEFGDFFIEYAADVGHGQIMNSLGADIVDFMENLNSLYIRLALEQPEMDPPTFVCDKVTPESAEVHYYSHRTGFGSMVVGCLKGVSRIYFDTDLEVELLQSRDKGDTHEVYGLKFGFQQSIKKRLEYRKTGTTIATDPYEPFHLSTNLVADVHPFHILMDKEFRVLQCGPTMNKLLPELLNSDHIGDVFKIKLPKNVDFNMESLKDHLNACLIITSKRTGLDLQGQLVITGMEIPGCPVEKAVILFLGSPRCEHLGMLEEQKIFLSDIPFHYESGDYVLMAEQRSAEKNIKENFQALEVTLREEKERSDALLQRLSNLLACFPFQAVKEADISDSLSSKGLNNGISGSYEGEGENQNHMEILDAVRRAIGPISQTQNDEDSEVELLESIGDGSYGKVYKGLWQGTEVAVKTIILPANMNVTDKREKMAVLEAAISVALSHPNVVQTYTYTIKPIRDSTADALLAAGMDSMAYGDKKQPVLKGAVQEPPEVEEDNGFQNSACGLMIGGSLMSEVEDATSLPASPTPKPTPVAKVNGKSDASKSLGLSARLGGTGTGSSIGAIHSYEILMVLELCDQGSLWDGAEAGLFKLDEDTLNYKAVLETALDIAKAMLHLHRNNILHADMKARNILLKSDGGSEKGFIAKVADFGLSVKIDVNASYMSDMCQGTLTHMSPELLTNGRMSKAGDVYAYGITLWELYTGGAPYKGTPKALLGHQVAQQGKRPAFPSSTPAEFKQLTQECWSKDAEDRPTMEHVVTRLRDMIKDSAGKPAPLIDSGCTLPPSVPSSSPSYTEPMERKGSGSDGSGYYPSEGVVSLRGNVGVAEETYDFGSALVGEYVPTLYDSQ